MLSRSLFVWIIIIFSSFLSSLSVNFENTWYRYSSYLTGNAQYENKLYSNTFCGVEIYDILENGDLVYDEVLPFKGLIHSLIINQELGLIFVLVGGNMSGSYEEMYCYKIQESGLEFQFISSIPNTLYSDLDCAYFYRKVCHIGVL